MTWQLSPACAAGACDVLLRVEDPGFSFTMKLTRAGPVYKGQTVANLSPCGTGANSIPDPTTLKIQIHVTAAAGKNQQWAATSLAGALVGTSPYVSSAAYYCTASTYEASHTGTPA